MRDVVRCAAAQDCSVSEGEVPALVLDPVADEDRKAALQRLHDLVAAGEVTLEQFTSAVELVLTAQRYAELEAVMAPMPPLVRITPAARRLEKPLEIDAGAGTLKLGGGWQLAAETSVRTLTGTCRLDLTQASWDSTDVALRLHTEMGVIDVIVPEGVALRIVSAKGGLKVEPLVRALPGAPRITVEASGVSGEIRIRHPREAGWRRWVTSPRRLVRRTASTAR